MINGELRIVERSELKKINKFYLTLFLVLIMLSIISNTFYILSGKNLMYYSGKFHVRYAEAWLGGEYPLLNPKYYWQGVPYLSTFSLLMAIFAMVFHTTIDKIMILFQYCLFPFSMISVTYLAYKERGELVGILTALLLFSSGAFGSIYFGGLSWVTASFLDYMIFPLVVLFFIEDNKRLFVLSAALLIYGHGLFSLTLVLALFFYSVIYEQRKLKDFLYILILCLPLLVVLGPWIRPSVDLTIDYFNPSLSNFIGYYIPSLFIIIGIPSFYAIIGIFTLLLKDKTPFEKVLIFWVLSIVVIFRAVPPFRSTMYFAFPFAILGAIGIDEILSSDNLKQAMIWVLFLTIMIRFILGGITILQTLA